MTDSAAPCTFEECAHNEDCERSFTNFQFLLLVLEGGADAAEDRAEFVVEGAGARDDGEGGEVLPLREHGDLGGRGVAGEIPLGRGGDLGVRRLEGRIAALGGVGPRAGGEGCYFMVVLCFLSAEARERWCCVATRGGENGAFVSGDRGVGTKKTRPNEANGSLLASVRCAWVMQAHTTCNGAMPTPQGGF